MSTITCCGKTVAIEGETTPVKYNSNDRLCLVGQRLVSHTGAYASSGSQYRTDTESFTKVTSLNTIYGGPRQFVVVDKSGMKKYYGKRIGN